MHVTKEASLCKMYSLETNYLPCRGPLILLVTFTAAVFPLVRGFSTSTIMYILFATLGIYVAIQDALHIVTNKISHFRHQADKFLEEFILDDFLQSLFGADGWFSCIWGSWLAIFILYLIPIDKDMRLDILTKIFQYWIPNGKMDVREYLNGILFQPGGIWKVDPKAWGQEEEEGHNSYISDQDTTSQTVENDLEMTWDIDTESLNQSETLLYSQRDRYEQTQEHSSGISIVSSPPIVTIERKDVPSTKVRSGASLESTSLHSSQHDGSSNTTKMVLEIIRYLIRRRVKLDTEKLPPVVNTFSYALITRIGMISSIMLLAQLRYSPKSRRTLWNVGRLGTTIGLITISASSCCTWYCRKKLDRWIRDDEDKDITSNFLAMKRIHNCAKSIFWRMTNDPKLKRKIQGIVACIVLYYFRCMNLKLRHK
jgi:hypothetical protein